MLSSFFFPVVKYVSLSSELSAKTAGRRSTHCARCDIAGDIDSITNIRNNIIHGDADPALSTEQIHGYVFKLDLWARCLVDTLNLELNYILN